MRVVLDWHAARTHAPGAGRYLRELTRALAERGPELDPKLDLVRLDWGRGPAADLPAEPRPSADLATRWVRRPLSRGWSRYWDGGLTRLVGQGWWHTARVDLCVEPGVCTSLAVAELPSTPLARQQWTRLAQRSRLVVVFAPAWRERVAAALQVPLERVQVVPVGCDHWSRVAPRVQRGKDVLVLGVRHTGTGLEALAQAAASLRKDGWAGRLVCAGRPGSADAALRALDPQAAWLMLAEPREAELPALVAHSGLLVYLPPDPGTPVTPLEGLALGTPVLCRRSEVLVEALGVQAAWFDEATLADPRAMATAMGAALSAPVSSNARDLVARHTWAHCAEAHAKLWRMHASPVPKLR